MMEESAPKSRRASFRYWAWFAFLVLGLAAAWGAWLITLFVYGFSQMDACLGAAPGCGEQLRRQSEHATLVVTVFLYFGLFVTVVGLVAAAHGRLSAAFLTIAVAVASLAAIVLLEPVIAIPYVALFFLALIRYWWEVDRERSYVLPEGPVPPERPWPNRKLGRPES